MTDEESSRCVEGRVALPPEIPAEKARAVRVQVEDVSRMDAPSTVVAEQTLGDVDLVEGAELPFRVDVPAGLIERGHTYSVRVHIDVTGTGEVTKGDYVSTASYPVLAADGTSGDSDVVVLVRRV